MRALNNSLTLRNWIKSLNLNHYFLSKHHQLYESLYFYILNILLQRILRRAHFLDINHIVQVQINLKSEIFLWLTGTSVLTFCKHKLRINNVKNCTKYLNKKIVPKYYMFLIFRIRYQQLVFSFWSTVYNFVSFTIIVGVSTYWINSCTCRWCWRSACGPTYDQLYNIKVQVFL